MGHKPTLSSIEVTVIALIFGFLYIIKGDVLSVFTLKHDQIAGNSGLVDERATLCLFLPEACEAVFV